MTVIEIPRSYRFPRLMDALLSLWRASVEATHDFLSAAEIDRIAGYVPQALREVPRLLVAYSDERIPLGFAGTDSGKLEMLFVAPEARGLGIGTTLLAQAVEQLGVRTLDVNEQNPQAQGFYEHRGFVPVGRSETDGQGAPDPLVHMELAQVGADTTAHEQPWSHVIETDRLVLRPWRQARDALCGARGPWAGHRHDVARPGGGAAWSSHARRKRAEPPGPGLLRTPWVCARGPFGDRRPGRARPACPYGAGTSGRGHNGPRAALVPRDRNRPPGLAPVARRRRRGSLPLRERPASGAYRRLACPRKPGDEPRGDPRRARHTRNLRSGPARNRRSRGMRGAPAQPPRQCPRRTGRGRAGILDRRAVLGPRAYSRGGAGASVTRATREWGLSPAGLSTKAWR